MSFIEDLRADMHLRQNLTRLGIVLAGLVVAVAAAIAAQWFIRSQPPLGADGQPVITTDTPEELTYQQKVAILQSLSAPTYATGTPRRGASGQLGRAESGASGLGSAYADDMPAPANDPRAKTLESLSASRDEEGESSTSGGMTAEEKLQLLESLR